MPERGSKTSTVPVIWATFGIFSAQSKWFPIRHNWWPWMKPGYISMTWTQSYNQWCGSIAAHPAPKNSEYKNLLEKYLSWFFGIQTAFSSLIIFQRAELSTRSITHLCWYSWRTFWRKNAGCRKVTKGVLFLHNNVLAHQVLATQKKLAYLGFQCLDHPPYSLDLAPLDWKNNWEVAIFRLTQRSLLPRRTGWMDNLLNFLEWLA